MKAKGQTQLKRCTEDTTRLLTSSRYSAFKDKFPTPVLPKTSKHVIGLHFEFPESDRLFRGQMSHRRVSSTDVGRGEQLSQLVRILRRIREVWPGGAEANEPDSEAAALELLETAVNAVVVQSKERELAVEKDRTRESDLAVEMKRIETEKQRLAGQEEELKQAKQDFDQSREQWERSQQEQIQAIQARETALSLKEREMQSTALILEKERFACTKMRKRLRETDAHVKKLQAGLGLTARTNEVQSRLKNIVKQESLLNAVAEDLQYQRSNLLAKLESTLTEIAPGRDAEEEEKQEVLQGPFKDCSNLMATRELRSRSKASTQDTTRLYRTLSRERPVDITEIYSEIEELGPLDLTPKDVLTPKSLRNSREPFEP